MAVVCQDRCYCIAKSLALCQAKIIIVVVVVVVVVVIVVIVVVVITRESHQSLLYVCR